MKKLMLCIAFMLAGCDSPQESAMKFQYGKDPRTGLCFAMYSMGTQSGTMTHVPCTSEVERQIEIDNRPGR